jgi:hypothetical protein
MPLYLPASAALRSQLPIRIGNEQADDLRAWDSPHGLAFEDTEIRSLMMRCRADGLRPMGISYDDVCAAPGIG